MNVEPRPASIAAELEGVAALHPGDEVRDFPLLVSLVVAEEGRADGLIGADVARSHRVAIARKPCAREGRVLRGVRVKSKLGARTEAFREVAVEHGDAVEAEVKVVEQGRRQREVMLGAQVIAPEGLIPDAINHERNREAREAALDRTQVAFREAHRQALAVTDHLIDLADVVVHVGRHTAIRRVVVIDAAARRFGEMLEDAEADRVNQRAIAVEVEAVAGDRGACAGWLRRVINLHAVAELAQHVRVCEQLRKIARAHLQRRHADRLGLGLREAIAFVVEEEEGAVAAIVNLRNPHRPADVAAEIVLAVYGPRVAEEVVDEAVGVQLLVAKQLVGFAMKLVAATLDREVDDAA